MENRCIPSRRITCFAECLGFAVTFIQLSINDCYNAAVAQPQSAVGHFWPRYSISLAAIAVLATLFSMRLVVPAGMRFVFRRPRRQTAPPPAPGSVAKEPPASSPLAPSWPSPRQNKPGTTAAQAPVPQAGVSPAQEGRTRLRGSTAAVRLCCGWAGRTRWWSGPCWDR